MLATATQEPPTLLVFWGSFILQGAPTTSDQVVPSLTHTYVNFLAWGLH